MLRGSFSNITDQVVEMLREGMLAGRWRKTIPGRDQLAAELGVSHTTMEAAMRKLTKEGMLVSQGPGKRRRIVLPKGNFQPIHFRLRILPYESVGRNSPVMMGLLDQLSKIGFTVKVAPKGLLDLGMDPKRIGRYVRTIPSDAWILGAGSYEVLKWFHEESIPVFGYFGGWSRLPVAGIGVKKEIRPVIRQLVDWGHRRIVLLARGIYPNPEKYVFIQNFWEALRSEGIEPGSYHLPDFGYQPEELHHCLDSIFKISPPTAIFVSEVNIMIAVRDYLTRRGILSPRDVSLISFDYDHSFDWCVPEMAHFSWDYASINRSVARWAKNVARGRDDCRQSVTKAKFVEGGTIGPAPKSR